MSRIGSGNCAGSTPAITNGAPLIRTLLPIAPAAPPNRRCHSRKLMTTTGAASARSSRSFSRRPAAADIPSTSNMLADIRAPWSRSVTPSPARLALQFAYAAIPDSVRVWLR